MGADFLAVELDNAIWFSTNSSMSWFLWHSSKWGSRLGRFLQYMSGLELLASSLDTDLNYVTTILQLHPSLNHKVKLQQLLKERCGNFSGVSQRKIRNPSSTLSWTRDPLLNFPAKCDP